MSNGSRNEYVLVKIKQKREYKMKKYNNFEIRENTNNLKFYF